MIDAKELKQLSFKVENDVLNMAPKSKVIQTFVPSNPGTPLNYYDTQNKLLYILYPESGNYYLILNKKKTKTMMSGTLPSPFPRITGIYGQSRSATEHLLYFYSEVGLYYVKINKAINAPKEVRLFHLLLTCL